MLVKLQDKVIFYYYRAIGNGLFYVWNTVYLTRSKSITSWVVNLVIIGLRRCGGYSHWVYFKHARCILTLFTSIFREKIDELDG